MRSDSSICTWRAPTVTGGGSERGQALLLLVGAMAVVLVGAFVLGAVARGVGAKGRHQGAADLAALGVRGRC